MSDGSDVRSEVQQGLEEERAQWQKSAREQIAITRQTAVERDHYKAEVERLRERLLAAVNTALAAQEALEAALNVAEGLWTAQEASGWAFPSMAPNLALEIRGGREALDQVKAALTRLAETSWNVPIKQHGRSDDEQVAVEAFTAAVVDARRVLRPSDITRPSVEGQA